MRRKMMSIIVCMLFIFSAFSILSNAKMFSVQEENNNVETSLLNFLNDPPFTPSNPNPANESTNIELNINLSWTGGDPDGDDVTYNIFFGTDSDPAKVETVYPDTIYNPGALEYDTQYYWRIDSYDDNGSAATGPIWTFTTKDDMPPFTPSNPNPANESNDVIVNTSLSWTGGDPDGDDVTYDIYFGTDSNPPNALMNQSNTTYGPGRLQYNTQYYWRIDSWDSYGYSTTGVTWTFTTKDDMPPFTPSNPNPANESNDVIVNTSLSWTGGDPDGDDVTYDIYFGTDSNPPNALMNQSNTTYSPGRLQYNTQYYWRIDSWDSYGYSTTGVTWTFTTKENSPPNIPHDPKPENRSTNVYIDATLSWTGGDPDGDNVTYDIYFGTDPNPPKVISNQSESFYEPNVMNITTVYHWRIDSWDSYGYSTTGHIWNFKTSIYYNSPPEKPSKPSGPKSGRSGISYTYSSSSTDSNGEPIYYMFDWDDGTISGWFGPYNSGQTITASHIWSEKGSYAIKVKAKDIYGGESYWSDPLAISMPKDKLTLERTRSGDFQAEMGLRSEDNVRILLDGEYRTFRNLIVLSGTGTLLDTDKTGHFQGISTRNFFIIQTAINNHIINIVGKYTSYDEENRSFNGIYKVIAGRVLSGTGWIAGSFS